MPDPVILECTLRDGSYAIDFQFTADDTSIVCAALEDAGFRMIEIGHGIGLGASSPQLGIAAATDEEYLKAAASVLTKAKFGAFFIPGIGRKEHLDLARDYGMGFVRIGTNITESEEAEEYVKYAKSLGFEVSYNAMKSYAVTPEDLLQRVKSVVDWGADIICLVDSAGGMLPSDVKNYIQLLRDGTDTRIGFHGHNNFLLGNANNLAALEAGATVLDSTIQGMGRGAGNAQTEVMVILYEKMGFETGIDKYKAMDIGEKIIRPKMKESHGVSAIELTTGYALFHSSFLKRIYKAVDELHVDPKALIIEVSKIDKVDPTESLIMRVARKIAEEESRKKEIYFPRRIDTGYYPGRGGKSGE